MMVKCPECGIEYSYGRNLCHICDKNSLFFGSLFNPPRRSYDWNCECLDIGLEITRNQLYPIKGNIDDIEINGVKLKEVNHHKWNCSEEFQIDYKGLKKQIACLYMNN